MTDDINKQRTTLFTVMITSFMTTFMASSINLALPAMGLEFGSSAVLASWAITGYILTSAIFLLPFGCLADMYGRQNFYRLGTILYTFFTLATVISNSMQMVILFRLLQGLSSAMIFSTGMAILSSAYPPQTRGRALGYSVAVTYLGLTIGPVLGGMMNHYLGWRSIFFLTTLLGLGAVTAIQLWLRGEWSGTPGKKFDVAGSLLYMSGLLAFLYGLSSISDSQWSPYLVLLGIAFLVGFVIWELRIDYPILQLHL
ncbi:MAG: MFS transporter, partial [Syntrophomonas sp.]|nr:MFS transporter [Syntrophomonas sp.]